MIYINFFSEGLGQRNICKRLSQRTFGTMNRAVRLFLQLDKAKVISITRNVIAKVNYISNRIF